MDDYVPTRAVTGTAASPDPFGQSQRLVAGEVGSQWWRELGSDKLNELIEQAHRFNASLGQAQATLRRAEHVYRARAGSTLYPQVDAGLGAQRQRSNPAAVGLDVGTRTFSLFDAGVEVTYDLDLSGGNRRALESLAAQVEYRHFELESARLALASNLINAAIRQAQVGEQVAATEGILQAQEARLQLTEQRLALGAASPQDVLALRTQVERTRAQLAPLRLRLERTNHLLATLLGRPPGEGAMPRFSLADFHLPTELPVQVPAVLVRRRPDIRASEALLHAATADYGVAVAQMFPRLSISAGAGGQALSASDLFESGSLVWGLAAGMVQPLFNRGLDAEKQAARAEIDAAAAQYRQTVLEALRSVADALRALEHDAQALAAHRAADDAAGGLLHLVGEQYSLGAASYLELLVAQEQVMRTRFDLLSARSERLVGTVALYQAMGGGWAERGVSGG